MRRDTPGPSRPEPAPGALGGAAETPGRVLATVVRAEDAPGPTLVVRLDQLPVGALALGAELSRLRHALAGTAYADLHKIALYGPAAGPSPGPGPDPDPDPAPGPGPGPGLAPAIATPAARPARRGLDYRFVQALPGGAFDFRAGCGHSLLACVVAESRPGPVTVRAVTTGDTVLCEPEPHGADAYTLSFLKAPTAPGTLPTGRPVDLLRGIPVSLVRYGNPYVFVDARHLPEDQDALHDRLLALRAEAARVLGHPPHSALPKIAAFTASTEGTAGPGTLSVRALTVGGWHPRLALTGAAALAAAGALDGTVVPAPTGPVRTPGGTVTVSAAPDRVRVHHKRAKVIGRLELPWRIHATA
ncbi:PrpF domain-containing protein [Streptomyces sp. NPDC055103]